MNMTMTCIIECLIYADPVTVGADGVFVRPRMFDSASMCVQECLIVRPCSTDLWGNVVTLGTADFPMCVQDCLYLRQMALA